MTGLKYIIVGDLEIPILFHQCLKHPEMAIGYKVVAAGFWNGKHAYGMSTGLNISSRPEDTEIIQRALEFTM